MPAKTPTAVIFDSLAGSWRLRRSLKSELPHFPSGTFEGTATFRPRRPSANNVASELLYSEQGELRTENGFTLKANRKYVYRYDESEDKINAWFVTEDSKHLDGREQVDYLFHDIENEFVGGGWVGKGEHLCELDMYWAYYEFRLPRVMEDGQTMDVFGVRFKVKGPQKDYTSLNFIMFSATNRVKRRSRSQLEYALLKSSKNEKTVRSELLSWLDERTLRCLRAASPITRDMVDSQSGRIFKNLYIRTPLDEDVPNWEFGNVAGFCQNLTITVEERMSSHSSWNEEPKKIRGDSRSVWWHAKALAFDTRASNRLTARLSRPFAQLLETEQTAHQLASRQWTSIFAQCRDLRRLTLRVKGDPQWPGRTEVEDTLIAIRQVLEQTSLPNLHEIRFNPIQINGLIHLRWSGLGSFSATPSLPSLPTTKPFWQNLQILSIHLVNPFIPVSPITPAQTLMFKKILHDYLRSFTPTLRTLRFVWLDVEGLSPMTLHLEEGLAYGEREPLRWQALEELWLGNIMHPQRTFDHVTSQAPKLKRFMVLRNTSRNARPEYDDEKQVEEAWFDYLPQIIRDQEGESTRLSATKDDRSSIYSRNGNISALSSLPWLSDKVADPSVADFEPINNMVKTSKISRKVAKPDFNPANPEFRQELGITSTPSKEPANPHSSTNVSRTSRIGVTDSELGDVSRTSRDITIMLDTSSIPAQAMQRMRERMQRRGQLDEQVFEGRGE
ncbi:hypothetical protein LTR17_017914 [Elasticomyces elasticus]|nr:hypothetical protein LTR17_017914 [Elasticomyces elasticus]